MNSDFYWYKLFRAKGFGFKSQKIIYKGLSDNFLIEDVFRQKEGDFYKKYPEIGQGRLKSASYESLISLDEEKVLDEYEALIDKNVKIITPNSEYYPLQFLKHDEINLPLVLFCKGAMSLLKLSGVSIIGSRDASSEGLSIATQCASELALLGENVVSGYAKGIDSSAHLGALAENGTTTIVLSEGILEFKVKKDFENFNLTKDALIVSHFFPLDKWSGRNAMDRNKLICALAKAVLVVESGSGRNETGKKSGTFESAKIALGLGIPLFVVSPKCLINKPKGNYELIEMGAIEIMKDNIGKNLIQRLSEGISKFQTKKNFIQPELF